MEELSDDWDVNDNGYFDYFEGHDLFTGLPGETMYDESDAMVALKIEDLRDKPVGATFIIDKLIRAHWYVVEPPKPDDDGDIREIKLVSN